MAREALRGLLDALSALPWEDALHLFWHAEGRGDAEILALLRAHGLATDEATPEALRKRRERLRAALREQLGRGR